MRERPHPHDINFLRVNPGLFTEFVEAKAGCGGSIYFNVDSGEVWLCDASDLILFRGIVVISEKER